MEARLNDGVWRSISIGPDMRRLVTLGDFNVEIDVDELAVGENIVELRARYHDGTVATRTVTVVRKNGTPVQPPIEIDWAREGIPNAHAQVVDGRWEVNGRYVTTREVGYDRLIAIGDVSWKNYEILVPVIVHGLETRAYTWPSTHTGVGVVMYWKGHYRWSKDEHASGQPRFGPAPYGAIGWWTTWPDAGEHLNFFDVDFKPRGRTPRRLRLNMPYLFRVRLRTDSAGRTLCRMRVWEEDGREPSEWDVTTEAPLNALDSGSLLLGAHETVAGFGPVRVTTEGDHRR
jgi:hypothetical protein